MVVARVAREGYDNIRLLVICADIPRVPRKRERFLGEKLFLAENPKITGLLDYRKIFGETERAFSQRERKSCRPTSRKTDTIGQMKRL